MTLCDFLSRWASFTGLMFDIAGAFIVCYGVHITLIKAESLESVVIPMTLGDIGGEGIIEKAELAKRLRVKERISARNYSWLGLACFVVGFLLQAIGSWPKPV